MNCLEKNLRLLRKGLYDGFTVLLDERKHQNAYRLLQIFYVLNNKIVKNKSFTSANLRLYTGNTVKPL